MPTVWIGARRGEQLRAVLLESRCMDPRLGDLQGACHASMDRDHQAVMRRELHRLGCERGLTVFRQNATSFVKPCGGRFIGHG